MNETIIYGIDRDNYFEILYNYFLDRNEESNEPVNVMCVDRTLQVAQPNSIEEMLHEARESSMIASIYTGKAIGISSYSNYQGHHAAASIVHNKTSITAQSPKAYKTSEKAIRASLDKMNDAYYKFIRSTYQLQS